MSNNTSPTISSGSPVVAPVVAPAVAPAVAPVVAPQQSQLSLNASVLGQTCALVQNMMTTDNYTNSAGVMTVINVALNTSQYVNMIKSSVQQIKQGGTFGPADIPAILNIVLQSQSFLSNTATNLGSTVNNVNASSMKYIIFGVLNYTLVSLNADPALVAQLDQLYSPLWLLLSFNPQKLVTDVKAVENACCKCF